MIRTGVAITALCLIPGIALAEIGECRGFADLLAGKSCCLTRHSAGMTEIRDCSYGNWSSRVNTGGIMELFNPVRITLRADAPIACADRHGAPRPPTLTLACRGKGGAGSAKRLSALLEPGHCSPETWLAGHAVLTFDGAVSMRYSLTEDRDGFGLSDGPDGWEILARIAHAQRLDVFLTAREAGNSKTAMTFDLKDRAQMVTLIRTECAD